MRLSEVLIAGLLFAVVPGSTVLTIAAILRNRRGRPPDSYRETRQQARARLVIQWSLFLISGFVVASMAARDDPRPKLESLGPPPADVLTETRTYDSSGFSRRYEPDFNKDVKRARDKAVEKAWDDYEKQRAAVEEEGTARSQAQGVRTLLLLGICLALIVIVAPIGVPVLVRALFKQSSEPALPLAEEIGHILCRKRTLVGALLSLFGIQPYLALEPLQYAFAALGAITLFDAALLWFRVHTGAFGGTWLEASELIEHFSEPNRPPPGGGNIFRSSDSDAVVADEATEGVPA
ncbi:MAG: hypothetical protein ACOY0T_37800 [Myxococcota bacterium]